MSKLKVIWTKPALNDLDDIISYIATDSVNTAIKQYERIKETSKDIGDFPKQGRIIPELQNENLTKFREIIVKPWRMMYRIEDNRILILAILDGRRNIEDILMKRQLR
ncbi:MAG: type II toxin-antitoxin system RelE/ParE family toxin [Spirochaetales bacterium]|nr:type II toxin-antitoxin system RelE/ParE family toxin [Spirochaetales bacterium]